ncbi:MAG: HAD-IIIA family hydrolase [candidate division Zixibacteria bacterium]|nr:HAD-IIIA family hydrolase [candidate division Zixibacteria bacterium]
MKTIIVIRLGRLGDVLLTSPVLKNLRFLYPESQILFITRSAYRSLAENLFGVNSVLTFPDEGSYLDLVKLSSELDEYQPDLVVDLHKNFRSFHLANLCKARYKVVYSKRRKERQAAVNDKKFRDYVPHTTDLYNFVIDKLKGKSYARRPDIILPEHLLIGKDSSRKGIAFCPGAGSIVKAWPIESYASLAERIIYDFRYEVHVNLSRKEELLEQKFEHLPKDMLSFHSGRPIMEIAGILSKMRLSVTNDSGLLHLSSAVATPTVALFGPTHQQLGFFPLGIHDIVLATDEKCRPCSLHGDKECSREEQYCFTRLTVDFVYEKIAERLEQLELKPAIFLDRDGTLIEDKHYLADPDKIEFIPGALETIKKLKELGYLIVIISNQSGVARGFFSSDDVERVHSRLWDLMIAADCEPDDVLFCPYHPDGDIAEFTRDHGWRKPHAGMIEDAAARMGIDVKRSFMIGDKLSDVQCGQVAGAMPILVKTGKGAKTVEEYPAEPYPKPYYICDTLADAGEFISQKCYEK